MCLCVCLNLSAGHQQVFFRPPSLPFLRSPAFTVPNTLTYCSASCDEQPPSSAPPRGSFQLELDLLRPPALWVLPHHPGALTPTRLAPARAHTHTLLRGTLLPTQLGPHVPGSPPGALTPRGVRLGRPLPAPSSPPGLLRDLLCCRPPNSSGTDLSGRSRKVKVRRAMSQTP